MSKGIVDFVETKKQLSETMKIIEDYFFRKCQNSDLILEEMGDNGWFYLHEKTANQLKRQLLKYKLSK